jgi:hypothetical protein
MVAHFFPYICFNHFPSRLVACFLIIGSISAYSQNRPDDITVPPVAGFRCRAEVVIGDTVPVVDLNTIYVYTDFVFTSRRHYEQWTRTKFNVKKVYPYAILAAAKLKEYNKALEKIEDKEYKKVFLKVCERDLRGQFENELKGLTVSQGRVLMKLIDRETGQTTYEIVKQLRGSFQAVMWQTLARIFGNNLKSEYDPGVEDIMIERAVKLVEAGQF